MGLLERGGAGAGNVEPSRPGEVDCIGRFGRVGETLRGLGLGRRGGVKVGEGAAV